MASGAGVQRRVQSRPWCSRSPGSVDSFRSGRRRASSARRGSVMGISLGCPSRVPVPSPRCNMGAPIWHSVQPIRGTEAPAMKRTSYPKEDIKVLLLEGVSRSALDTFRQAGYSQIEFHEKSLPEDELKQRIADAHIVGIRSRTHLY